MRVTFSLSAINGSDRVWLVALGSEKADVVRRLVRDTRGTESLPATLVRGIVQTILYTDQPAPKTGKVNL